MLCRRQEENKLSLDPELSHDLKIKSVEWRKNEVKVYKTDNYGSGEFEEGMVA